jgi:hypothetical protein
MPKNIHFSHRKQRFVKYVWTTKKCFRFVLISSEVMKTKMRLFITTNLWENVLRVTFNQFFLKFVVGYYKVNVTTRVS